MIDEKNIQQALEWADKFISSPPLTHPAILAAAYREKCDELDGYKDGRWYSHETVKGILKARDDEYREKCEELKLEKMICESYQDSARVLYEECKTLKTIGNDLCFFLKNRITDVEQDPVIAIRRWKEFIK